MLKNLWWPIEFSSKVSNRPHALQVVGQKLVLWRNSRGDVHCLSDLCVHRGGSLAGGWLTPDAEKVVCPYHGWEFDGEGACTKIPAHPQRGIPKKARVDSYPVVEKYGWVWAFLGDLPEEERPPIPSIPELENEGFKRVEGSYYWNVNYERAIENAMDPSHAAFVHGSRFGNINDPSVQDYQVNLTPWSGLATVTLKAPPRNLKGVWGALFRRIKKSKGLTDDPITTEVKAGYYLPNINLLHVPLPIGNLYLLDANVPIDEQRTRSMYIGLRDFLKADWADRDTHRRINDIFRQDDSVLTDQRPEMLPYNLSDELHVRSDALQVSYRRRRNELIDQGWGVDMHQIVGDGPRDVAVVIPSPARRNNPELANAWVHKEVQSAQVLGKTQAKVGSAGGPASFEIEEGQSPSTKNEVSA